MQVFPQCHSRGTVNSDKSLYFCAHPSVHTPENIVFPSFCHACTCRLEPEPEYKRDVGALLLSPDRFIRHLNSVAIAIPCHNYGQYLAMAIESVLQQSYRPAEIVAVNDCSTDDTCDIVADFAEQGVRLITIAAGNVHVARRVGVEATNSQVICFLDNDIRNYDKRYQRLICDMEKRIANPPRMPFPRKPQRR